MQVKQEPQPALTPPIQCFRCAVSQSGSTNTLAWPAGRFFPGELTTVKPLLAKVLEVCCKSLALGSFHVRTCTPCKAHLAFALRGMAVPTQLG